MDTDSVPSPLRRPLSVASLVSLLLGFHSWTTAQEIVLVEPDSTVRYVVPSADSPLGTDWVDPAFDDVSWNEGSYGVGYNAGGMIHVTVPEGTLAVYTRAWFRLESIADACAADSTIMGSRFPG